MAGRELPMLKRTWLWTPILLGALAAGSYAAYRWLTPPALPEGLLYGGARVEGTEVTVSSEVAARVIESALIEGATVRAGELLVRLDPKDIEAQRDRARAEREAARRERERLARDLATAEHHLATARRDDRRYEALVREGTIAFQQREQASNVLAEAQGRVEALNVALTQATARIEALDKTVQLADSQLAKAVITAPLSGSVLVKSIEVGELATPGRSIATLVDLDRIELKIYIPEQDIGKLRLGNDARVRIDAFPGEYIAARVSRIDSQAQFTPRDIHMPDERVRLVFGVTLALDNPVGRLKPGMPADAWVRWNTGTAWPAELVIPQ
ncbi:MAG TPA: efflux RND transporter periplasmic adaptor subunit [Steroidobacteraceae bacterium]|nr:efflux RND transporter periplasmic adaptor subunit [Steroidobacteraceae bacterium]